MNKIESIKKAGIRQGLEAHMHSLIWCIRADLERAKQSNWTSLKSCISATRQQLQELEETYAELLKETEKP